MLKRKKENIVQEVQLPWEESNTYGIKIVSILFVGRVEQDEVGFMYDDQGVNPCQVWGGAPHLPPIFLGEFEAH